MSRKIMFAVTCYSGKMDHTLVLSLLGSQAECANLGWEVKFVVRASDSIIARARNVIATTFLESDCSDLIMIDDDVAWQQGAIARMIAHPVDLVAGAYPARGENAGPPFIMRPIQTEKNEIFFDKKTGLIEVEGVPAGFLRISKRAMTDLADARKDRWYEDQTAPGMKIRDLFDFAFEPDTHCYFSEDYTFCRRYREIGGQVWVDPELMLHHTGSKCYSGKLGDWLREHAAKAEPIVSVPSPLTIEPYIEAVPSNAPTILNRWAPDRSLGGTEIMVDGLKARLGAELNRIDLYVNHPDVHVGNRFMTWRADRPQIIWFHCDIDQQAAQWLYQMPAYRDYTDRFVFVSEWQRDRYLEAFKLPPEKCRVLRNATDVDLSPLPPRTGPVKLAYTSTPFRGLDVLLNAWAIAKPQDAELHIWSGMALYGPEAAKDDAKWAPLYATARAMPGVTYHGIAPNAEVRAALRGMDILAYPCTFAETSCLSVIEALAAGCDVICPRFGALEETCHGHPATLYEYSNDRGTHARGFAFALQAIISTNRSTARRNRGQHDRNHDHHDWTRDAIFDRYDWSHRIVEWRNLIDEACTERGMKQAAE